PIQGYAPVAATMKRRTLFTAVCITFLATMGILHASTASAQADRGRIIGTVIDTSGGALPGVTVTLTGSAVAPTPVITDSSGRYLSPWLMPGTYNVTFELGGFDSRGAKNLTVRAGETLVVDAQLPLAQFSETVEVKAAAPPPPPAPRPPPPPRPKMK